MNLLILFNEDWSADLIAQTLNESYFVNKEIHSTELPTDHQSTLGTVIQSFRGVGAEWVAKQANASEITICAQEALFNDQGELIQEAVYQPAIELSLYVVKENTRESKWIKSGDMDGLILSDPSIINFWNYIKNF